MSGSSTVFAARRHFAVVEESVRKRFETSDEERSWHSWWKEEHQKFVDTLATKLEPILAAHALPYGEWTEDAEGLFHMWVGNCDLQIAFASKPAEGALAALEQAIREATT